MYTYFAIYFFFPQKVKKPVQLIVGFARWIACVAGGIWERAIFGSGAAVFDFSRSDKVYEQLDSARKSSRDFAARVHGFAATTKALAHEIQPATQATRLTLACHFLIIIWF